MASASFHSLARRAGLLALLLSLAVAPAARAQININIISPAWGPPAPPTAQYYYLSGVEGYYDLRAREYVYLDGGRWARARALPGRYRGVTLQPVVVDYVGATPWVRLPAYRTKYPKPGWGNGGLPPGQAKKMYGGKPGKSNEQHEQHEERERHEDHGGGKSHGGGNGGGHGKGHGGKH